MPLGGISRTAVVDVLPLGSVWRSLVLLLSSDNPATVSAGDQASRVGKLRIAIDLEVRPELVPHRLERLTVNQRRERAGMPHALILNLADVAAVVQQPVQRG